jgi:hypothetical protein
VSCFIGPALLFGRPPNEHQKGVSDMKKNINEFLPQRHPTKAVFALHHIPVAAVARFLGLSASYVCSLLNGFARVSPENDAKLRQFAQLVEREAEEATK